MHPARLRKDQAVKTRTTVLITPAFTLLSGDRGTVDGALTPADTWSVGPDALAARVARLFTGEGVILVDAAAADTLNVTDTWTTYEAGNVRAYLGRLDTLTAECDLVAGAWHQDTVAQFDLFHRLTGVAYHRSPGVAGLSLLQHLNPRQKGRKQIVWDSQNPGDVASEAPYFPGHWQATPPRGAFLHAYDKRRSGLAAMNVLQVARYSLKRHPGKRVYDRSLAGWWLAEVPAWNDPRMPDPAGYGETVTVGNGRVARWLTGPTIDLLNDLAEQGVSAGVTDIHDAYLSERARIFLPWADRVEQAFQQADTLAANGSTQAAVVAETIKGVYRETAGMFVGANSWVRRSDWFGAKVAMERANGWRTAWKVGNKLDRWPVMVDGDAWWYADDREDGAAAAPVWTDEAGKQQGMVLGTKLGHWRHHGTREAATMRGSK